VKRYLVWFQARQKVLGHARIFARTGLVAISYNLRRPAPSPFKHHLRREPVFMNCNKPGSGEDARVPKLSAGLKPDQIAVFTKTTLSPIIQSKYSSLPLAAGYKL